MSSHATRHAFKFISGKYQGGEFPIPDDGEMIIGRAADVDMVLVEDMVSRKHAKLVVQQGTMILTDLASTNGTFVNGEKIKRAELHGDDRVLIGTNILKVVSGESVDGDEDAAREMMDTLGRRDSAPISSMSGDLEEVPLPDLLQLFSTNRKTGVLTVQDTSKARLYLKEGVLQHVHLQSEPNMAPMKAMCRLLAWTEGSFQFEAQADFADVPASFNSSTENVLMEAMRQSDEAKRLLGLLPPLDTEVQLAHPLRPALAELAPAELALLQLCHNHGTLKAALDRGMGTDGDILLALQKLLKAGFLQPG